MEKEMEKEQQSKDLLSLVRQLSEAKGVPGFEKEPAAIIQAAVTAFGSVRKDMMQNVYLERAGNSAGKRTVMLDAHMDEVGFMVQSFRPQGTVGVLALGGWPPGCVQAQRFLVQNKDGKWLPAVSCSVPPHYQSAAEKNQAFKVENLELDLGASSAAELKEDFGIRLGAPVVPETKFSYLGQKDLLFGKAFDCRLGCAAVIRTLELLDGEELNVNLVAAFSVQEEVGTRGAYVTVSQVKPDLALVYEGSPADDTMLPEGAAQTALGKGPMLRHIDNRMITHPGFQRYALDLAEKKNLPVQEGVRRGGATNGAPIHLSERATPAVVLGIPVRYIHTHTGIAKLGDVEAAAVLGAAIIRSFGRDPLAEIS